MTAEQIASMDYITLRATTEGILANLTNRLGYKDPAVIDLKNIFARYDAELSEPPTQWTAHVLAERRAQLNPETEYPR